jgi:hypothetical protein
MFFECRRAEARKALENVADSKLEAATLHKSDLAGSDQQVDQQSAQMAARRAAFLVPMRQTGARPRG